MVCAADSKRKPLTMMGSVGVAEKSTNAFAETILLAAPPFLYQVRPDVSPSRLFVTLVAQLSEPPAAVCFSVPAPFFFFLPVPFLLDWLRCWLVFFSRFLFFAALSFPVPVFLARDCSGCSVSDLEDGGMRRRCGARRGRASQRRCRSSCPSSSTSSKERNGSPSKCVNSKPESLSPGFCILASTPTDSTLNPAS